MDAKVLFDALMQVTLNARNTSWPKPLLPVPDDEYMHPYLLSFLRHAEVVNAAREMCCAGLTKHCDVSRCSHSCLTCRHRQVRDEPSCYEACVMSRELMVAPHTTLDLMPCLGRRLHGTDHFDSSYMYGTSERCMACSLQPTTAGRALALRIRWRAPYRRSIRITQSVATSWQHRASLIVISRA